MRVVYSRWETPRRKQKRFYRQLRERLDYDLDRFVITLKFTRSGRVKGTYDPTKRRIKIPSVAWETNTHREMWLAVLAHELGHAADHTKLSEAQRGIFLERTSGHAPNFWHTWVDTKVPSHVTTDRYLARWFWDDRWWENCGEFFADCFVKAFSDLAIGRNPDSTYQFSDEAIGSVREFLESDRLE